MVRRSCSALLALALLVWAADARAERATIHVYSSPEHPESSMLVRSAMGKVLAASDLEVVSAFADARSALIEGAVPEPRLRPFGRAEQLLEEGWRSYLEARAGFAAARLAEARTASLAVAHLPGGLDLVAEVSLRLAVAKLDLNRRAEAADDFRLSRALDPGRGVDDAEFKPEVVAAYAVAIAEQRQSQTRPLLVRPTEARVLVDGVPVAPGTVELRDGLHLVSVSAAGYRARSQLVSVSPGGDDPIELFLEVDPEASLVLRGREGLSLGTAEAAARQSVSAVLLYAATDQMLLLASVWRRGQPALLGQRCAQLPARCSAVVEIGYPPGGLRVAAGELWRNLASARLRFPPTLQVDARVVAGEPKPGQGSEDDEGRPLWKNRWLWVGVAAASVAGGAAYLLAGEDELSPVFAGARCDFGGCP